MNVRRSLTVQTHTTVRCSNGMGANRVKNRAIAAKAACLGGTDIRAYAGQGLLAANKILTPRQKCGVLLWRVSKLDVLSISRGERRIQYLFRDFVWIGELYRTN